MSLCLGEVVPPGYPDGELQCVPPQLPPQTQATVLSGVGFQPGQAFQPPSSPLPSPERRGRASSHCKPPQQARHQAPDKGLHLWLGPSPSQVIPGSLRTLAHILNPLPTLSPHSPQALGGKAGCLCSRPLACAPSHRARGAQTEPPVVRKSGAAAARRCVRGGQGQHPLTAGESLPEPPGGPARHSGAG